MRLKSILFSSFLFGLFVVSSASATCMATCSDTDAGIDPRFAGVVIQQTSCSAPGGPVNTTVSQYFDRCENGVLTEYSCEGQVGVGFAVRREVKCLRCDPVRQGVCLQPQGAAGAVLPIDAPTYTWSTSSGGGPRPRPDLPPQPICPVPVCAAPPPGCNYTGGVDANGCSVCGELQCESPIRR